jgi:hypothetical protein
MNPGAPESSVTRPQREKELSAGEGGIQIFLNFVNRFANMAIGINNMKRAHRASLVDSRISVLVPFVNSLDITGPGGLDSASGAAIHSSRLKDD